MGLNEMQSFWRREMRRLLWLMAALFVTVMIFQYIEVPKGTFVLSIFSTGRPQMELEEKNSSASPSVLAPEPNDPLDRPPLDNVKDQYSDHDVKGSALAPVGQVSLSPVSSPPTGSPLDNVKDQYRDQLSSNTTINGSALALVDQVSLSPVSSPPGSISTQDNSGFNVVGPNSNGVPPHRYRMPVRDVYTLADMDELLTETHHSMEPLWPSKADQELLHVKLEIENAAPSPKDELQLYGPIYRNITMFRRSYELMEQTLKVYVYKEGERPVFHQGPLEGIYASEGWFMKLMESNKHFVTRNPKKAHLFYIPFSSRNLEEALYVPNSHSHKNLIKHLDNYLDTITRRYNFWNRTGGADHFLVACHDWAPSETRGIMSNCIRAMCNADVKEGFKMGKDVSLPETYIPKAKSPLRGRGGKPPSQRRILAFFAGQMHGYLRPILLRHWQNIDPDMKIFGQLPHTKGNKKYIGYMQSSKYCICAKGYEVNSPRVVEAIFYECVPVIISDNFVPPFFETLNWESFAVFVPEKDIPNLKTILESIPEKTYLRLYMRVKKVQQHFLWRPSPLKYDLFHMILHSIWYNRVFQSIPTT